MQERKRMILGALAALSVLASACSSSSATTSAAAGSTSTPTSTSSSSSQSSASDDKPVSVAGKSTFELEADDFYFEPATLDGDAGQTLTLTVKNHGQATHTFTIDDQGVDVTIDPGGSQDVEVTFPDSGTVEFYCKFHASQGMTGQLEVT